MNFPGGAAVKNLTDNPEQQWELDMEKRTGSKLGKEYIKAVILSPCLCNFYAEYIMRNAGLEETSWNQDFREKYQ